VNEVIPFSAEKNEKDRDLSANKSSTRVRLIFNNSTYTSCNMKHQLNLWTLLLLAIAIVGTTATLTSCGKEDEPASLVIDYYIEVEEEFLVDGTIDHTDRYYSPVAMMKEALQKAYPTATATGDDQAAINACNELYQRYYSMYDSYPENLTCLVHLVKATMSGDIVKSSERLATYQFDVNPKEVEPTE